MTANHNAEGKRWEWTEREERYLERLEQFGRTPGMHWLLEHLRAALGEIERLNAVLADDPREMPKNACEYEDGHGSPNVDGCVHSCGFTEGARIAREMQATEEQRISGYLKAIIRGAKEEMTQLRTENERLNEVGRSTVEEREQLRAENERLRDDATELTNAAIRDGNERARLCEEIERLRGEVGRARQEGARALAECVAKVLVDGADVGELERSRNARHQLEAIADLVGDARRG